MHTDAPTIRETERAALPGLRSVLELTAAGRIRCSDKTKRPTGISVAAVAQALPGGDFYSDLPIASYAWPLLVQAGALAQLSGTKLLLTAKGRALLAAPTANAIRDLWLRWLADGIIDEFSRIEDIKGQRSPNVLTAIKTRRAAVGAALKTCPIGEWITVDDLFAMMRRRRLDPKIARNERALFRLHIGHPEHGSLGYSGYGDWSILQGRYTLAVLFEYAATLGLIDVGFVRPEGARTDYHENFSTDGLPCLSRYDGLQSIRLNPLGAFALGLSAGYTPPEPTTAESGSLTVLPNFDIVAVGEIDGANLAILTAFADRTADRVFRLRKQQLLRALHSGRTLDELRTFLGGTSEQLPDTVRQMLADVDAAAGRTIDRGIVRLVECADPATAQLIASDRTLRRSCRLVGPQLLAIDRADDADFRAGLLTLGLVMPPADAAT